MKKHPDALVTMENPGPPHVSVSISLMAQLDALPKGDRTLGLYVASPAEALARRIEKLGLEIFDTKDAKDAILWFAAELSVS